MRQSQERLKVGPLAGEGELRLEGVMSAAGQDQAEWGFALAVPGAVLQSRELHD